MLSKSPTGSGGEPSSPTRILAGRGSSAPFFCVGGERIAACLCASRESTRSPSPRSVPRRVHPLGSADHVFFAIHRKSRAALRSSPTRFFPSAERMAACLCASRVIPKSCPRRRLRRLAPSGLRVLFGSLALRTFQCSPRCGSAFQCCAYGSC